MNQINGGVLLGSRQQSEQAILQMRFAASISILAELASIDYATAINRAAAAADPMGVANEGVDVSTGEIAARCNPEHLAMMASLYAEHLLIAQGFLKIEKQTSDERSEFEKAAN